MAFDYLNYQRLEYIEGTGTQYIDSEINSSLGNNIKIVSKIMWTGAINDNILFGVRYSSGNTRRYPIYAYYSKWALGTNAIRQSSTNLSINTLYDIEAQLSSGDCYLKVNGNTLMTSTDLLENSSNYNFYLFANNRYGTAAAISSGRMYDTQVYDTRNNFLMGEFIPALRKSDNAAGMYDTVTEEFRENIGTGVFLYGELPPSASNIYVYDNGTWKKGTPYVYDNGTWKKGKPYVYDNGAWKS